MKTLSPGAGSGGTLASMFGRNANAPKLVTGRMVDTHGKRSKPFDHFHFAGNLPGSSADAEGMSWALIANWQRAGFDDYRPVIVATVVVSLIVSRHR